MYCVGHGITYCFEGVGGLQPMIDIRNTIAVPITGQVAQREVVEEFHSVLLLQHLWRQALLVVTISDSSGT